MNKIKVIDTTMDIAIKVVHNVFRIETDPDDMTCKISYINEHGEIKHDRIKVGPRDTNKVVIY